MIDAAACLRTLLRYAPLTLRLYAEKQGNDYAEPERGGYEAQAVRGGDWEYDGHRARCAELVFKFTGRAGMVRGWYLTAGDEVLASGAFADGPYSMQSRGGVIRVRPEITLRAEE